MANSDKSVARNELDPLAEPDIRDTVPDDGLDYLLDSRPSSTEEKSRIRLIAHDLLAQSMDWYGKPGTVPIHDLQSEQFQMEQSARIIKFRQNLLDILNKSFFDVAIDHIETRVRGYSPQKAQRKTVDYLQRLYAAKFRESIPLNRVKDLQTIVMNSDWKTVRGIKEMRDTLQQMLLPPPK